MCTLNLGRHGTVFQSSNVECKQCYTCSIEISFVFAFCKSVSLFCVGAGCDISNGHMKYTKCLLFPSAYAEPSFMNLSMQEELALQMMMTVSSYVAAVWWRSVQALVRLNLV